MELCQTHSQCSGLLKQEWTKPGFVQVTTSCSGDYLTEHFSLSNSLNMSGMAPPLLLLPSLSISCSSPVNQAVHHPLLCAGFGTPS